MPETVPGSARCSWWYSVLLRGSSRCARCAGEEGAFAGLRRPQAVVVCGRRRQV
ncbi:hypothetical protein ACFFX0_21260 [Citricoccus parietis]|uniref:Uncharacterized protein n=1 Tax=Citricoccus parietis TaxID=592307 RepID=A0ABV5G3S2_9MICC